ncbi:MAG: aminopeptidase P family protein [Ignavibacteriae bacterium]|nr:MAG: aminopeptidase P family protein [Ignavibacteriota bacterium]
MRKLISLTFLCFVVVAQLTSQTFRYEVHDADHIPPHVYKERRERLMDSVGARSIVAVMSADVRNRQNDVDYEYRQSSNMLYLTGYPDPGATLLLAPSGIVLGERTVREILFVKERNVDRERWTGVTAGPAEAMSVYGIDTALANTELTGILKRLFSDERGEQNTDSTNDTLIIPDWPTKSIGMALLGRNLYVDSEVRKGLRDQFDGITIVAQLPTIAAMREVKDTAELRLMRKAIDISVDGHRYAIRNAKPGMKEYQIEALVEFGFKNGGAEDVGYPSIVGARYNACILHYTSNRMPSSTGDLILSDCGAEYHGYTADVTRTFPINGRFTDDQRTIYNIVLEAQDSGIAACKAGAPFSAPHEAAKAVIARRLFELGIIESADSVKRYFMHGTSHYLGLDVHDAGTRGPLRPNTVVTVEPGIYIAEGAPCDKRWWNIGIRIEDDILITSDRPVNLSGALERTAEAIEKLMTPGEYDAGSDAGRR